MPHLIIVKVQWMEKYEGEMHVERPWGKWVKAGNPPGERYNFQKQNDGRYYAHINSGGNLNLRTLDPNAKDEIDDVIVAFVAPRPEGTGYQDCVLVGYYNNATLYSEGAAPLGIDFEYFQLGASSENATLLTPENRNFSYRYRSKAKVFTYGNVDRYADDELIVEFINSRNTEVAGQDFRIDQSDMTGEEGRRLKYAARYERYSSGKIHDLKIRSDDDLRCEACSLSYNKNHHVATKRMFEVHHKAPLGMLENDTVRSVVPEDLSVLCANCHRAVHATGDMRYISNIAAFRGDILGRKE